MDISIFFEGIDDCFSNPCLNGGECVDGLEAFNCNFEPGFTGLRCEQGMVIENSGRDDGDSCCGGGGLGCGGDGGAHSKQKYYLE